MAFNVALNGAFFRLYLSQKNFYSDWFSLKSANLRNGEYALFSLLSAFFLLRIFRCQSDAFGHKYNSNMALKSENTSAVPIPWKPPDILSTQWTFRFLGLSVALKAYLSPI
jgi:hypothetical protein